MFNGPGYNPEWLLMKAEHEFKVAMSDGPRFVENAANLSVSLAHMADWVFAFKPPAFASYNSMNDVLNHVKVSCPKAALFFDINNEYKHAQRKPNTPSTTTASLLVYCEIYKRPSDLTALDDGSRIFSTTSGGKGISVFTPKIKDCTGVEFLFSDCAKEAIQWWRSVI
jgi:hypothetical protein